MAKNSPTRKRGGRRPRKTLGLPPEEHGARATERYQASITYSKQVHKKAAAGNCKGAMRFLFMAAEKLAMASSDHSDANFGVRGAGSAMSSLTQAEEAFTARCVR